MILHGHVLDLLKTLEAESVQCVVTSPPYWGLRDYGLPPSVWGGEVDCGHDWTPKRVFTGSPTRNGNEGLGFRDADLRKTQRWHESEFCNRCEAWRGVLGLEPTPEMFVAHLVDVFAEIGRVLAKDGTAWLNLGDTYATGAGQGFVPGGGGQGNRWLRTHDHWQPNRLAIPGLKKKDRVGIPHRTVLALQAWGWWWRDEVVWHKPNPMPSSTIDRTTPAHEMLFLLTRSAQYYSDFEAIKEPATYAGPNGPGTCATPYGQGFTRRDKQSETARQRAKGGDRWSGFNERWDSQAESPLTRNRRSVWTIPTSPFPEAHFATFPEALVRPCVLAGSRAGDVVLDPFAGSGTVGVVAKAFGREFVGIDLNPEYVAMAERRIAAQNPALPLEMPA